MTRLLLAIIACCLALTVSSGAEPFKSTVQQLKTALAAQDMPYLTKHIALQTIVQNKIKKYVKKASEKDSVLINVAGKLVNISEPLLTKMVSNAVLSEYGKASPDFIGSRVATLKFTKFGEKGSSAYALGSFWGSPGSLTGLKNAAGDWVIVDVQSAVIDQELRGLLQRLKVIK